MPIIELYNTINFNHNIKGDEAHWLRPILINHANNYDLICIPMDKVAWIEFASKTLSSYT